MATFAAFEGRLLAALTAEKTETHQPFGPAKVVRFVSDAEMTDAAAKFARTIGFTGIGSLDFIRREHGKPLAIEFNPRATLLVDTGARMGVDLMGALAGAIRGEKSLVEPVRQMAVCSLALGS
jgi:predicted ATP-grasp superfamily ATP-dependent carboligase